ncbi:MAG: hypothetical protein DMG59_05615 [Acidobacteria bacterium]|nr:MAG: hypothetical protein DMG59_05615 [Acidobacteriota bacterium]
MADVVATVIITVSSALLFGYWFRYTCLLILTAKTARDYAWEVAEANHLCFPKVQSKLRERPISNLDRLRDCLDRDYIIVIYLLGHTTSSYGEGVLEKMMLAIDYRMMGAWYRVSRWFSPKAARDALEEMTLVVAHFANAMGERAATSAA